MENIRFKALSAIMNRQPLRNQAEFRCNVEQFGEMTFGLEAMKKFLTEEAYKNLINSIERGDKIDRRIADQVAASLKAWAISKGATHYTHWFHPLTGNTAEKHDSFLDPAGDGKAIEKFKGSELVQQEPDASSFPSGGIRNTFEARGYTAWDPTSPAFILDSTLCIPTIFVSYTGEALDYKTPLLRALNEVDLAGKEVCKFLGFNESRVFATLGWEQEYFVVDAALYAARPDLMLTRRTVFGHASAKDQQLSDHYFGTIPTRIMDFMKEYEYEAHRLGIPVKTRHNEVAPNQYELAPVFEEVNLAIDHNQLMMHLLKRIAPKHNLVVLLHEKPFAKVNGSGKHNNWSLATGSGKNLLAPGKNEKENIRFLTFLTIVLKAVESNSDLLRAAIATASNDQRLGGHEAPPAIISAFVGSHLSQALEELASAGKVTPELKAELDMKISKIPGIMLDNTDRNRTSPFAFTGNKFEFRAVGSSQNCSTAMIALNLIMADQMKQFMKEVTQRIEAGQTKDEALFGLLAAWVNESSRIRFEGNCYSEEWKNEAARRGLSNHASAPEALAAYVTPQTIALFERNNVLNERELRARYDIKLERYVMELQIESRVMGDLATNHIIPIAIRYQNTLIENVKGLKEVIDNKTFVNLAKNQVSYIKEISEHISNIKIAVEEMTEERKKANAIDDNELKAAAYRDNVKPFFETIRHEVDKLEMMVDDELWPLPKYREMLFAH
ncbi:MAG: glutamine synthetase III [Bacteroidales bacterium]|nr:glutamine synthetase III [Bacteroidales bacterium]MDD3664158.1 glutamine synthetase III [Bacteroidales bacterium]